MDSCNDFRVALNLFLLTEICLTLFDLTSFFLFFVCVCVCVCVYVCVANCSEHSQTQRIIIELKTNASLSPSYSTYKSLHHKSTFLLNNNSLLKYFTKKPIQHNTSQILQNIPISLSESQNHTHIFEMPTRKHSITYISRELNTGTCITCLKRRAG